jgi:hypothetical protein
MRGLAAVGLHGTADDGEPIRQHDLHIVHPLAGPEHDTRVRDLDPALKDGLDAPGA